ILKGRSADPMAWATIIFFGACALVFIWQLIDTRPRLVIDDKGVYFRPLKMGVLPWTDIEDAYVNSINQQLFICLQLRDTEKYLSKLSPLGRSLCSVNVALGFTPISLTLTGLDVDPYLLCDLIRKRAAMTGRKP